MKNEIKLNQTLYSDIKKLIEEARIITAQTINSGLTMLYWNVGKRINEEILNNKRAGYGEKIIATLSHKLTIEFGKGFSEKNIRRMVQFQELFPDIKIVASLMRQLSWTHFTLLIPIDNNLKRDFYVHMCRIEQWSVRTLRDKIDTMLYERTAISKKPEEFAKLELKNLSEKDKISPDLVFKNPYILDFLNLKDTYLESDLEKAILKELEQFILELGKGFTFVARQKRMIIDNEDFYLDLLFYHRKLKRLVAIDLKLGKFKAAYKGQMELYLKWLEKNEMEEDEHHPIGMILCAEAGHEQIELLELDRSNIRIAEYITELLSKNTLKKKLRQFYIESKKLIENRGNDE